MRGFKFNFITVLAFILLILYAYFAAMGFLYDGYSIEKSGVFFIGVIVVISLCIYLMCTARATRWDKVGTPVQIALGVIIIGIFVLIGKPFSTYITVMSKEKQIYENVDKVIAAAGELNDSYNRYAQSRLESYHPQETSEVRKNIRKRILEQTLCPAELSSKQIERKNWLQSVSKMKLSNVQMPNNIKTIENCVSQWIEDYQSKASICFSDETDVIPFKYDFEETASTLKEQFQGYSKWAILVAIICSVFMLVPYFTTDTFIGAKTQKGGIWFKIKSIFKRSSAEEKINKDYL